jgi:hypothetical protein
MKEAKITFSLSDKDKQLLEAKVRELSYKENKSYSMSEVIRKALKSYYRIKRLSKNGR